MNFKRIVFVGIVSLIVMWKFFGDGTKVEVDYHDDSGQSVVGAVVRFEKMNRPPFVSMWQQGGATVAEKLLITTDSNGKGSGAFSTFINEGELEWRGWDYSDPNKKYWGGYNPRSEIKYIPGTKKISYYFESLVMRRKISPHPMTGSESRRIPRKIYQDGSAAQFDFIQSDWLPPYGEGKYADMEITAEYRNEAGNVLSHESAISWLKAPAVKNKSEFKGPLELHLMIKARFLGEGNGFVLNEHKPIYYQLPGAVNQYMDQYAPEKGYVSSWEVKFVQKVENYGNWHEPAWGYAPNVGFRKLNEINETALFFLRIRNGLTIEGKSSVHYGFFSGDIIKDKLSFNAYAINFNPDERNIECSEWKPMKKPDLWLKAKGK